jgi:DNA-directed RNA polymerase specialized sigma24 family protein
VSGGSGPRRPLGSDPGELTVAEMAAEIERLRADLAFTRGALADLQERFAVLARARAGADPLRGLREVAHLGRQLRELESGFVELALAQGLSYGEIAAELGVSRQAVHQRHQRAARPPD